ncbi:helix-turn-helix transcriptional regulator [Thalassobacillus hwangdonensis]|uniref:Helix-turn-helix transcriptional regulator n=1 Tax=Thalassobacillus hwangdonensis TaxID=546108 RepID=A0ABW3L757_9BACI
MSKAQRLITIILEMNNKRRTTISELAELLAVSSRTIARDLQELSELNYPIYSEMGRNGGYRVLDNRFLPPIMFSEEEALAVYLAIDSMKFFGATPFDSSANDAANKFYKMMPDDVKVQIDQVKDKISMWHPHRAQEEQFLKGMMDAVLGEYQVDIHYASTGGVQERSIHPVGLYSYKGYWYAPSFCHLRKAFRLFRLDRITSLHPNEKIPTPGFVKEVSIRDWLEPPEETEESYDTVIELSSDGVRRAESNLWFRESLHTYADGTGWIEMRLPVEKLEYYAQMVWELGSEAVVKKPDTLKSMMLEKAAKLINHYQ